MKGTEQRRMGTLVGRGPSYGIATTSCLASGQPSQLGMVPSHQFVLLCCWRVPHVAQPWQRGRQLCPCLLPIPVFLEASLPAQHHMLSQGNMAMVGGAMLGTDHRLNLDGVYFFLRGPRVTAFQSTEPTPLPPLVHGWSGFFLFFGFFFFLFLTCYSDILARGEVVRRKGCSGTVGGRYLRAHPAHLPGSRCPRGQ